MVATILVFAVFPAGNLVLELPTKDYDLWYGVGLAVAGTGRLPAA